MSAWQPSWILGGAGFRKEPSPSEAQSKKISLIRQSVAFLSYLTETKFKMAAIAATLDELVIEMNLSLAEANAHKKISR
jgi:hypothetical protein